MDVIKTSGGVFSFVVPGSCGWGWGRASSARGARRARREAGGGGSGATWGSRFPGRFSSTGSDTENLPVPQNRRNKFNMHINY